MTGLLSETLATTRAPVSAHEIPFPRADALFRAETGLCLRRDRFAYRDCSVICRADPARPLARGGERGASPEQVALGKGSPSAEMNRVRPIRAPTAMPSLGGIREAERLTLLRPAGGKICQARDAEASGERSIDRGLNDVGREERQ